MPPIRSIILVSHTHWDREWYLPFEDFRWLLVKTIDQLLDLMESNPRYRHFTLDGQTILLDDYLEIRPQHRGRIEKLVKTGRLHVGPWYVLADEFLVSGEALIRNLLYGHQIAQQFGGVMPIGYVPDTFGHIAQLPQILRGFGLDSSVWWRGLEDHGKTLPTELRWRAPDGSEVLVVHLRTSYSTAANLANSVDVTLAQLLMPMNLLAQQGTSSAVLLLNGSDHLPPQPFLPDLLEAINQRLNQKDILEGKSISQLLTELMKSPLTSNATGVEELGPFIDDLFSDFVKSLSGVQFHHGTLMDYVNIVRKEVTLHKLPLIEGEQHSSKYIPILPGVFSARIYLKQANVASQQLLERWAEPFATLAWWLGAPYPFAWLRRAWQLLLQNHPHDSICGCSVDTTHADMERRFDWSQQLGNQVLSEAIAYLNKQINSKPSASIPRPYHAILRVFNPHPRPYTDIFRILLQLPFPPNSIDNLALYDSSGRQIPLQLIHGSDMDQSLVSLAESHMLPESYSGEPKFIDSTHQILLTFLAPEIPGLGYQTFYLAHKRSEIKIHPIPPLTLTQNKAGFIIENPSIKLTLSTLDGTLTLDHKLTQQQYKQLLIFENGGDIGDEYNFCPPQDDLRISSLDNPSIKVKPIEMGPVAITLEVISQLKIPAKAHRSRKKRSKQMTKIPLRNLITVYAHQPRIDITTTLTNTAKDHRLRVLFPTNISVDSAWADTPFHVTERSITPAQQDWETSIYPMMMDFYLTNILNRPNVPGKPMGWFEDSTTTHAQQTFIDVTNGSYGLLVASRGLPEYELLSDEKRTIALTLLRAVGWLSRGDLTTRRGDAGPVLKTPGAQCLGTYSYYYSIIPHQKTWRNSELINQVQSFVTPLRGIQIPTEHEGPLPPKHGFLSIEPSTILFSCLKKAETQDNTILRFYELTGDKTNTVIRTFKPLQNITEVNLAEKSSPKSTAKLRDSNTIIVRVSPFRIHTLQLEI